MAPAKTAMAKDPKTPKTSKRGNWQFNGQWVDKEGYKVDGYGKRLGNQAKPYVPANKNPFAPKASTPTTQGPAAPTAQEDIESGMQGLVKEGIDYAQGFDPNTFQQQYEPQYEQGMQRAYDTIYNQFERKNQEQFARQNEQLQQSLVERGLDPNSPAYQALTKQLAEQQGSARQDAQNAAWQAAQGYQQQGFTQATGSALLPSQIASPYLELYGQQQGFEFTGSEADKQRQFEARQAQLNRQNQLAISRRQGGGGGGYSADEAALAGRIMGGYGPQQGGGQSTLNAGIGGAAQGIGQGITGRLNRPS
jgi:hypothetical protein